MCKRLTACLLALCLATSLLCSVSAKEPEISVEIDQTGRASTAAVITLGSEVYTSILVKVPGEPWYDFTWVLDDAKSMTLPVYENGSVQVQATRENGTKATASATVDCLPEPEPLDYPVESEPESEPGKEPEPPEELENPQPEPEAEEPEDDSSSAIAAVILLLVILAGGAVFVVKLLRRKEKTPSRPPEDDDEDYVVENVEEES